MEDEEIKILKVEIESLKSQIRDIREQQSLDYKNVNDLIKEVYTNAYQYIADIHDYLWPLVHKIFPDYAKTQKQIDIFMQQRRSK